MKRILVVDDSQAVRETLALILEREFVVIPSPTFPEEPAAHLDKDIDLLILGLSPESGANIPSLVQFTGQISFPVLFLIDSRSTVDLRGIQGRVDWLAKPFNPYELRERVGRLLAQRETPVNPPALSSFGREERFSRYIEFPYLSIPTALLAQRFAQTNLPILIYGELGCGQDQVAKGMYVLNRKNGPWISVYLAEMNEESLYRQIALGSQGEREVPQRLTLFLNGLETLHPLAQSWLLRFLEEEEKRKEFWILSSSRVDLLEKVYRGEFLDSLYYRLATLTLRLSPLRERREDLPFLAGHIAHEYAERLSLGEVAFAAEALDRIENYLWFGNLSEMETVIARTLAVHRKSPIEGQDLLFGFDDEDKLTLPTRPTSETEVPGTGVQRVEEVHGEVKGEKPGTLPHLRNGDVPDLRVLIHELAHELKNPMVTIKTFAQLLEERFDDATFRARFQGAVNNDIERMDDLLEALLEFARFTHPASEKVLLFEQMRRVLEGVIPECIKREATIRWGKREKEGEVFVDEAQFRYALRNVLLTVLSQVKAKSEVQIEIAKEGELLISYFGEGGKASPLGHYLNSSSPVPEDEGILPLRILLSRILLKRNGGGIEVNHLEGGKVVIRVELPAS
ncbi:MAG: sigma 54-interacting transcriptional regulator [Candidatus Binatia bacterium]